MMGQWVCKLMAASRQWALHMLAAKSPYRVPLPLIIMREPGQCLRTEKGSIWANSFAIGYD